MRLSLLIAAEAVQEGILLFADMEGSPMPWLKRYFIQASREGAEGDGDGGSGGAGGSGAGTAP